MKNFGSLTELLSTVFRKDTRAITLRPNQTVTYGADRDIQLPQLDGAEILVGRTSADTGANRLKNKDLDDDTVKFVDSADTSKALEFETSGSTTSTTTTIASASTASRTITLPDASVTLASLTGTETLTNKTLTTPVLTEPEVRTALYLKNTAGAQPELHFFEDPDNGTNRMIFKAAPAITTDFTLEWPVDDGTSGQVLTTNGSGVLSWVSPLTNPMTTEGDTIYGGASGAATRLAFGAANTVLRTAAGTVPSWGKIVNADVDATAAVAYSKLNLSGSIVNADISGSAAIAYSKLNLSGSIVNADVSGSAAIAYSKLNLSGSIVNADISSSAAIAGSKLQEAGTGNPGAMSTSTQSFTGLKTFTSNGTTPGTQVTVVDNDTTSPSTDHVMVISSERNSSTANAGLLIKSDTNAAVNTNGLLEVRNNTTVPIFHVHNDALYRHNGTSKGLMYASKSHVFTGKTNGQNVAADITLSNSATGKNTCIIEVNMISTRDDGNDLPYVVAKRAYLLDGTGAEAPGGEVTIGTDATSAAAAIQFTASGGTITATITFTLGALRSVTGCMTVNVYAGGTATDVDRGVTSITFT